MASAVLPSRQRGWRYFHDSTAIDAQSAYAGDGVDSGLAVEQEHDERMAQTVRGSDTSRVGSETKDGFGVDDTCLQMILVSLMAMQQLIKVRTTRC